MAILKNKSEVEKISPVVLAKNTQGYKNLVKLTTISHLEGVQGKGIFSRPCVNKELLKEYREGLIVTSACLGGEIPQAILQEKPDIARRVAKEYKDVFGEDFYLEIQDHGSQEDRLVNVEIVKLREN
jgi:DNA polymerase-3 subunit alpha